MREEAVDTGGPSREFWRLVMQGIQNKYCHGEEGKMVFARNTPALQVCTIFLYTLYQPTPLLTTSSLSHIFVP